MYNDAYTLNNKKSYSEAMSYFQYNSGSNLTILAAY